MEDVHWWFVARRRIFLSILDRRMGADAGGRRRILDLGCGTGTMLGYLARYGQAEGVDVDAEAIEYCHARGLDGVRQAAAERLPFDDGTFDLVTAFDVVEHTDDDVAVLREVRRVLKPDGKLLMSVPAFRFLWGRQDEISLHRRRYTAPQARRALEAAGLSVERLSYMNSVLFPPIAAFRLARRLLPRPARVQSDFTVPAPGPVNTLLGAVFGAERFVLGRFDLPFGVSIMALAQKAPG